MILSAVTCMQPFARCAVHAAMLCSSRASCHPPCTACLHTSAALYYISCSDWWQCNPLRCAFCSVGCVVLEARSHCQPPHGLQVASAVGGRRKLRRRLTGWLHLSRSYVGRLDAVNDLHKAQPSALAYQQVMCIRLCIHLISIHMGCSACMTVRVLQ